MLNIGTGYRYFADTSSYQYLYMLNIGTGYRYFEGHT